MLETLDARLAQAHGGELGHLDFLQVLCQDEITRRETVAFQRRLQRAKFEQQVTLEEFDFTASSKLPAAQIRDLGALRWLHAGESVILFGPVGVGKTHIAQALGHLAVRQGAHVRFAKTSRILADLAGGHADRTWEKRIRELVRPDVLILDDFAMRQMSAAQADDLDEMVSERQGRSLIITSNRVPSDWYPLFPNPVVAESLLDRLINTSHQVIMNGPRYRPNKRPKNRTDKPSIKWPGSVPPVEHQLADCAGTPLTHLFQLCFGEFAGVSRRQRRAQFVDVQQPEAAPLKCVRPGRWGGEVRQGHTCLRRTRRKGNNREYLVAQDARPNTRDGNQSRMEVRRDSGQRHFGHRAPNRSGHRMADGLERHYVHLRQRGIAVPPEPGGSLRDADQRTTQLSFRLSGPLRVPLDRAE
jgi:DNA replication protein DnaC